MTIQVEIKAFINRPLNMPQNQSSLYAIFNE